MAALRTALDDAQRLLAPAWGAGNHDILVRLHTNDEGTSDPSDPGIRKEVLAAALRHLLRVHNADIVHEAQDKPSNAEGEYDEASRKTLYGLLDLLTICGILPFLTPGVAAKHRPRPVISSLRDASSRDTTEKDLNVLRELVDGFGSILERPTVGLAPLIRERVLVDIVAGAGELAFCPGFGQGTDDKYENVFVDIVSKTPISSALPLLTYLIQPTTPAWLKVQLSKQLSLIPLRERGVRHTIEFIASSYPQPPSAQDSSTQPKGPSLSVEALTQASKLLSSVPSSLDPNEYFSALAPQLWSLLDGNDGPELSKAAALTIGSGILGKKALGAPGAVGWRLFAEPLLSDISPQTETASKKAEGTKAEANDGSTLVPEEDLKRSLRRLCTLLASRPTPGLTKRLVGRLMLPLWALLNYAKSHPVERFWRDTTQKLLETYVRLGAGAEQLETLATNLLWNGTLAWTFAPGANGGVEIRRRETTLDDDGGNIIEQMGQVEQRMAGYQDIMASSSVEDQDVGDLFVRLSKRWLLPGTAQTPEMSPEEDPLQSLIIAKLVMGILDKFKDKLATDPHHMIKLVKQLLDAWVESDKATKKRDADLRNATYAGLRNIVSHPEMAQKVGPSSTAEVDSGDVLPVALSLLSTIISAESFRPTSQASAILSEILPTLEIIHNSASKSGSRLPVSVALTAANLKSQLSSLLNIPQKQIATSHSTQNTPQGEKDRKTLQTALNELTSPTPPVRASALAEIAILARSGSPAIDVPQLTLLLLRSAIPDPDEYVVLHAIKTLVALGSRDPPLVTRLLCDAFEDAREEAVGEGGLEARLRVGEALGRMVGEVAEQQQQGVAAIGEAGKAVVARTAAAAVKVAGRRGKRAQDLRERQKKERLERKKQRDAERAWGGSVPVMPALLREEGEEEEAESEADARDKELLASIVAGWSDTGLEEDVRLRALALGVLGAVLESPTTLALLAPATVDAALEIALASCALEMEAWHAILRRAAVRLVFSLLKALDAVHDDGIAGDGVAEGAGVSPRRWVEVERVVRWAADGDEDEIAKGHAREVLEALETWRVKKALGVRSDGSLATPGLRVTGDLGLGELRGLNVSVGAESGGEGVQARKRLVVEEIE